MNPRVAHPVEDPLRQIHLRLWRTADLFDEVHGSRDQMPGAVLDGLHHGARAPADPAKRSLLVGEFPGGGVGPAGRRVDRPRQRLGLVGIETAVGHVVREGTAGGRFGCGVHPGVDEVFDGARALCQSDVELQRARDRALRRLFVGRSAPDMDRMNPAV